MACETISCQQQLASSLLFTVWQFVHIISVSLQESVQNGMKQHIPVKNQRQMHHSQVFRPAAFLEMFGVSLLHTPHIVPPLPPPAWIIVVWGTPTTAGAA